MTETPRTPGTTSGVMATPDEQTHGSALEQVEGEGRTAHRSR